MGKDEGSEEEIDRNPDPSVRKKGEVMSNRRPLSRNCGQHGRPWRRISSRASAWAGNDALCPEFLREKGFPNKQEAEITTVLSRAQSESVERLVFGPKWERVTELDRSTWGAVK